MDKLLFFQDRNGTRHTTQSQSCVDSVGASVDADNCLYIHFDPLRNANQTDHAGDFDVDYVLIKFTDASVLGTVIRNIMTNINSTPKGVVRVLEIFGT